MQRSPFPFMHGHRVAPAVPLQAQAIFVCSMSSRALEHVGLDRACGEARLMLDRFDVEDRSPACRLCFINEDDCRSPNDEFAHPEILLQYIEGALDSVDGGSPLSWGWYVPAKVANLVRSEATYSGADPASFARAALDRQDALVADLGLDFAPDDLCPPPPLRYLPVTHSPIEQQLLEALIAALSPHAKVQSGYVNAGEWVITTQFPACRYRVDISVRSRAGQIAVEADGHAFHERTKKQASHDRRRDRRLQQLGWYVFRFTGSDIHRDARACAQEVVDLMEDLDQWTRT